MGFNATVVVLNDRLDEIERDPEFGKKLARAIREHSFPEKYRRTYVTGQTQVVDVQHADTAQIIVVGANCGRVLGYGHWTQSDDNLIKNLNADRLRKKREAKS